MMSETFKNIYDLCLEKNLTFAIFRLPGETNSTTYIQTDPRSIEYSSIHEITEKKGFIMAPFDTRNGKKYIMVRPDITIDEDNHTEEVLSQIRSLPANNPPAWDIEEPVVTGRKAFLSQVKSIQNRISTGAFQKAVLSRIRTINGNYLPHAISIFHEVCKTHPNAFVYLFKSNGHFWLGASPEPLLRLNNGVVSTVSLAGTRKYSKKNMECSNWTMKEVLEQEYVTRYIHDVLRQFHIRDYRVTSPYVKKAGDILHLRSDFTFSKEQIAGRTWELLDALHPTPAVAGQPKEEAISFIKQIEPHDREYYSGFLGPVQSDQVIDLFVNLRCMKITPGYVSLYIGGGITLESVPEDEWEETQLKAKSLLNIINSYPAIKDEKAAVQTTHR
jgi:isochorismate synthase